jgi:hypothetical protein
VFWSTHGVDHKGIVKGKLIMSGGMPRECQQTPMKIVYWYQKDRSVIKPHYSVKNICKDAGAAGACWPDFTTSPWGIVKCT